MRKRTQTYALPADLRRRPRAATVEEFMAAHSSAAGPSVSERPAAAPSSSLPRLWIALLILALAVFLKFGPVEFSGWTWNLGSAGSIMEIFPRTDGR